MTFPFFRKKWKMWGKYKLSWLLLLTLRFSAMEVFFNICYLHKSTIIYLRLVLLSTMFLLRAAIQHHVLRYFGGFGLMIIFLSMPVWTGNECHSI
jgi:hypothetical protein